MLFLAQFFGIDLTITQQVVVMLVCILGGVGTAGVPAGSLPVVAMILVMVKVPPEGIGLILGVDRFLDMCRTTLNVTGDLVLATVVSRGEEDEPIDADDPLRGFLEVMRRLRRECDWKAGQSHLSLVRYLLEEAHETVEAIEAGDRLGDVVHAGSGADRPGIIGVARHGRAAVAGSDGEARRAYNARSKSIRPAGVPTQSKELPWPVASTKSSWSAISATIPTPSTPRAAWP